MATSGSTIPKENGDGRRRSGVASIVYQDGIPVAVRAYAGRDKATGQVRNLYRSLPPGTTEEEAGIAKMLTSSFGAGAF